MLGVHVQYFENPYNADHRHLGEYFCCDISVNVVDCVQDLTDLNVAACTNECEPYLELCFKICFTNGTCSNLKNETAVIDDILATCISPLLLQLHSNEFMIDNIINVSAKKLFNNVYIYIVILDIHTKNYRLVQC